MLDYLSRINNLPTCQKYNKIRACKLQKVKYPSSIIAMDIVDKSMNIKKVAIEESIPEFIRFNIVEKDVFDVK